MVKTQIPVNEPCPFCGDRYAKIDTLNYTNGKPAKFRVQCQDCGTNTRWYDTEEEAWKAWNNRHVKMCNELKVFIFNSNAFIYKCLLYVRSRQSLYCYAQKEFRGELRRINKSDFLSAYQKAADQVERTDTEHEIQVRHRLCCQCGIGDE